MSARARIGGSVDNWPNLANDKHRLLFTGTRPTRNPDLAVERCVVTLQVAEIGMGLSIVGLVEPPVVDGVKLQATDVV